MKKLFITFITLIMSFFIFSCVDGKNGAPNYPTTPTNSNAVTSITPNPVATEVPSVETKGTTPKGIKLKSSSELDLTTKNGMDSALTKLFKDVQNKGYTQRLKHSEYTITIKDDCIDKSGTMSFLIRVDSYNNTEYDQNPDPNIGEVYAAEAVTVPSNPSQFIICKDSVQTMTNTTRYGAEHIILFYNDKNEYNRTAVHNASGHPIISEL